MPLGPAAACTCGRRRALRAAERAEREAALARAREEAEASLNAEILLRANETAELRATVETLKGRPPVPRPPPTYRRYAPRGSGWR